ncbi:glutamate 5-kinase, partial [Streptomyces sp. Z38]|nr:glutamate 5-kinase [Streptomyces sp. Z38]
MAGARQTVGEARRIVVKVGSSSLTTAAGGLDADRVDALVDVLAKTRKEGAAPRASAEGGGGR